MGYRHKPRRQSGPILATVPGAVDSDDDLEPRYADQVLEGWAQWARERSGPSGPTPAGVVLQIPSVRDAKYRVPLTDGEFTIVDRAVARLVVRLHEIVDLEYRNILRGRRYLVAQAAKPRLIGLVRIQYRERLKAAQWSLYANLQPAIDDWRQRTL